MHLAMYLLPWREPAVLSSLDALPATLGRIGRSRPLVVTDRGIVQAGLLDKLRLAVPDAALTLYDETPPGPTAEAVEAALGRYLREGCDCLIALGGGSPMDLAKATGARVARPRKPLSRMRGQMKVRRRIPPLIAIPTTAGTGSEVTLAAVITDTATHEKYAINDLSLIPRYAVLDPLLTASMPPSITAQTGMDALTHAIEAYIGKNTTKRTRRASLQAIALVHDHLVPAYSNGGDLDARLGMQRAAYLAGTAFTRSFVGYVHAIAHQLGALYGMPHGLACAILLPHVLSFYGGAIHRPMADIYVAFGGPDPSAPDDECARFVIGKIHALNRIMNIPLKVADIPEADIPRIARSAYREATPLYPAPRMLDLPALEALVRSVRA